ncbi:hypothetical protein FKR81_42030 [Lentzea tibetensis]|uniref:Uncharacterized protein n=1 Tax=Lentzea tibetensis TaxID=2591470 RepID=A0A563EEZ6_9PSEU|nr:hypothetical protein [Lentzea tibetensis]TWP43820.1 hypothetical protein FKR81_42030 [Lentzea tibetensis]
METGGQWTPAFGEDVQRKLSPMDCAAEGAASEHRPERAIPPVDRPKSDECQHERPDGSGEERAQIAPANWARVIAG